VGFLLPGARYNRAVASFGSNQNQMAVVETIKVQGVYRA